MYVKKAQKEEPSTWEFVEVLFDMTDQIERERYKHWHKEAALLDEKDKEKTEEEEEEKVKFLDKEIASTCGDTADSPAKPNPDLRPPEAA